MISVESITKWYGEKLAVNKISFSLEPGEVLAFIGPNGAGKSTSMRIITGFIPASSGTVKISGHDINDEPVKAKRHIGYLPENAPLYNNMTVMGFLNFAAEVRGFRGEEKKVKINEVIKRCALESVKYQAIDTLSKGYRHRTCFAQALIHDPEALILDEPTDGLDPNQKHEARNLIKEMGKDKAIIISTHILEEVESVAGRVILINDGENIFDGTPEEFKRKSEDAGAVKLEIFGKTPHDISEKLNSLSYVKRTKVITQADDSCTIIVYPDSHIDCMKFKNNLREFILGEKWVFGEFSSVEGKLDEVFRSLTLGKEAEK